MLSMRPVQASHRKLNTVAQVQATRKLNGRAMSVVSINCLNPTYTAEPIPVARAKLSVPKASLSLWVSISLRIPPKQIVTPVVTQTSGCTPLVMPA